MPYSYRAQSPLYAAAVRRGLDELAESWGEPDLLHAHVAIPAGAAAARVARRRGVPLVLTEHWTSFASLMRARGSRSLIRSTLRTASQVVAVGPILADEIRAADPNVPVVVIGNVVDTGFYAEVADPEPPEARPTRLLVVGYLIPRKGLHDLLDALSIARSNGVETELAIVGDGPLRSELEDRATSLGLGGVCFFDGPRDRDGVRARLQWCDALVVASHHETFGVTVAEALASGRPVIATRCGGPEFVMGDSCGGLVPVADPTALAEAIADLAAGRLEFDADAARDRCARGSASRRRREHVRRLRRSPRMTAGGAEPYPVSSDRPRPVNAVGTVVRSSAHALTASTLGVALGLATSIVRLARARAAGEGCVRPRVLDRDPPLARPRVLASERHHLRRRPEGVRRPAPRCLDPRARRRSGRRRVRRAGNPLDHRPGLEPGPGRDRSLRTGSCCPCSSRVLCIAPCLRAILVGNQRVALASWLELGGRAITFLLLLGVALMGLGTETTADRFIVALLVGSALAASLFLPVVLREHAQRVGAGLRTVIRFSTPAYGSNVLQYLNYRFDLFFVACFRDLREVGLYALAVSLAQLVWLVSNAVATVVFARVGSSSDDPGDAANRTAALARSVLVIQILLAGALAVLAKPLLQVLYGTAFEPAVSALWLLLPGVAVFGGASVLAAHLAGLGRPGLNLRVAAVSLVVTVALNLLLVPQLGMNGAALASTASYVTTWGLTALLFSRATGVSIRRVLAPRRADLDRLAGVLRSATWSCARP